MRSFNGDQEKKKKKVRDALSFNFVPSADCRIYRLCSVQNFFLLKLSQCLGITKHITLYLFFNDHFHALYKKA